jgi:hypothetical protein
LPRAVQSVLGKTAHFPRLQSGREPARISR